jgi:hypothetical protein
LKLDGNKKGTIMLGSKQRAPLPGLLGPVPPGRPTAEDASRELRAYQGAWFRDANKDFAANLLGNVSDA